MTPQRRVILEEVERAGCHPAADEVYERVRRRLPRISLGTVYRNLEVLSERGLISKIDLGDGHRRFDARQQEHYHVRCLRCGRIEDVFLHAPGEMEDLVRRATDYDIEGHRLDFYGRCPDCRAKEQSDARRRGKETRRKGTDGTGTEERSGNNRGTEGIED